MNPLVKIPRIFFGFLSASFLMWCLINLSKEYKTVVNFTIEYKGLSQEKIFREDPIKELPLELKSNGFKLFSTNISSKKIKISLDKVRKGKKKYYIIVNTQKAAIQRQLASGIELVNIEKDTIYFNLASLKAKTVPVKFNNTVQFKPGYGLSATHIKPDSILISGPDSEVEAIHYLSTKKVDMEEVSEDLEMDVAIELPQNSNGIKLSNRSVNVAVEVDKFTEGTFEIPVKIINIPANLNLNIYPKKVTVIYKVGLKNYSKITEDSFEVICDYKSSEVKGLTYLIPQLKSNSTLVSSVRVSPQKIDFLIHK